MPAELWAASVRAEERPDQAGGRRLDFWRGRGGVVPRDVPKIWIALEPLERAPHDKWREPFNSLARVERMTPHVWVAAQLAKRQADKERNLRLRLRGRVAVLKIWVTAEGAKRPADDERRRGVADDDRFFDAFTGGAPVEESTRAGQPIPVPIRDNQRPPAGIVH